MREHSVPEADQVGLYELPARYRELQEEARNLAAQVADRAEIADEADSVDPVMRAALAASGLATVRVDGDELVVSGHKSFITNGGDAAFYSVLAKEGEQYSLVFVPADTPGVQVTRPHQIIAPHVLGDVVLDEVRVPLEHRLGEPGKGFALMLATLATFRVSVAGAAVGVAQAALDEALRHTSGREQFGVPIARLGPVPSLLALSWTEIEMARSLTYRAAAAAARDPYT